MPWLLGTLHNVFRLQMSYAIPKMSRSLTIIITVRTKSLVNIKAPGTTFWSVSSMATWSTGVGLTIRWDGGPTSKRARTMCSCCTMRTCNKTLPHIHRLGTFLGRHLSPQAVAAIADYTSFANMSVNPFTNRAGNPMMDFSIARFLRKGVVGDWKNYFTAEQDARFKAVWKQKMSGTALYQ